MRNNNRGVTLPQCMLLLMIIMILGAASFRWVTAQRNLSLQSHWGRTADAIADGALEMALVHLENEGGPETLTQELSTGLATAKIEPGESTGEFRVVYSGKVSTEKRIRSQRTYRARLTLRGGRPTVSNVQRLLSGVQ